MKDTYHILLISLFIISINFNAYCQVREILPPPLSSSASLTQNVGYTQVTIEYSRPNLNGRVMYSELAQAGQVWRTGANWSTKLSVSDDIFIEGLNLKKGVYSIWTKPGEDEWEIIVNDTIAWGTQYNQIKDHDLLHFKVKPKKNDRSIETFEMRFTEVNRNQAVLGLYWSNVIVEILIEDNYEDKLKNFVIKTIDSLEHLTPSNRLDSLRISTKYFRAAIFNSTYTQNLDDALIWIDKSILLNSFKPNDHPLLFAKAQILDGLNRKDEALRIAKLSLRSLQNSGGRGNSREASQKTIDFIKSLESKR